MAKEKPLNPREVARKLGIRLDTVYTAIWAGKLPATKQEGRWSIPASAVDERLKSRETKNG
jgi:excisionase family DNA binding protein